MVELPHDFSIQWGILVAPYFMPLPLSTDHQLELRAAIMDRFKSSLRDGQKPLANWRTGELAVSAVPGAGKSHSMAVAAALTIAREKLHGRKQLIIVTLTRSAAANIKIKIDRCLQELSLPPVGYSVSTIHSLAWSIATRHPELSKLNTTDSTVIMPHSSHKLIRTCVERWLPKNVDRYHQLLAGESFDGEETERLRRQSVIRNDILPNLTLTAVREAKSSGLSPTDLAELAQQYPDHYDILGICAGLYQEYQDQLQAMNYLDHDEMIGGALRVLQDPVALKFWQQQVHAVFEDEAQDSSPLQEKLLGLLAAGNDPQDDRSVSNFIRVGDPNQSINSSYTPADPTYFRDFCSACAPSGNLAEMNQAGRSATAIIDSANFMLHWGNKYLSLDKPTIFDKSTTISETVFWPQDIQPVGSDDPQPNPNPIAAGVEVHRPRDIFQSIAQIGDRIIQLFQQESPLNIAILVRENRQARFINDQLTAQFKTHPQIKIYAAGISDRSSQIPSEMLRLLQFVMRPHSPDRLKDALNVLLERKLIEAQDTNALAIFPERFLYPTINDPSLSAMAIKAQTYCTEFIRAKLSLPHYQLISYLADRLEYQALELATADKLAERIAQQSIGNSSLAQSIQVLQEIAQSENFANVDEEADDRFTAIGQVTIMTMHKAKGLDWDVVFLPFLHKDSIPGSPWVTTGAKFLGDFNIGEVARAQIRALAHQKNLPSATVAWQQANFLKQAESFRLLYVAMTRAKKLLWMAAEKEAPFTWNRFDWPDPGITTDGTPQYKLQPKDPCPAIPALENFLQAAR
jgi:DNA helicase II / ATP-dependent DNA helicase PcrA